MHIIHVFKTYFPDTRGGLERVIRHICQQSTGAGAKNTILTLSLVKKPEVLEFPEATVIRYPVTFDKASSPVSLGLLRDFRRLIAGADLLHYHFPWPFADILHLSRGSGKRSLVTYHSDAIKYGFLKKLYRPVMNRFLGATDRIVVTSENYLRSSADLAPFIDKTAVIPIGIDEDGYPDVRPEKKAYWQSALGENFFLFVGVLRNYKGLHVLIDAACGTDHNVVIVGSGPLENELRAMIASKKAENVEMTGALDEDDKVALLSLCRAVVFPSHVRAEAFGLTLLEGAMFGKPLISTEIGTGTSYVNKKDVSGLVIPPSDTGALRDAMSRLADDQGMALRMGRAARERFEKYFTSEKMGEKYLALYNELLQKK